MTLNCGNINLKKGSTGAEVKELQTILKEKGYYNGKVDSDFGDVTLAAVKSYQKKNGLLEDGVVGPVTCKKLQTTTTSSSSVTLKKGSKGTLVQILQQKLRDLGYYNAECDSDFGSKTESALKTYQKYYNLVSDGVYGPLTQKVFNETKVLSETTNSKKLSRALGVTIKDHGTLYQAVIKRGKYSYYNNDIYTYSQEITKIVNNVGINCTDWAQCGMWTLIDMGFPKEKIRIVRGTVTCSNNGKTYGHVWLQIYLNGKWVNYDLSAAAAHSYGIGTLICTRNPKVTNINPGWAVSDDGIT